MRYTIALTALLAGSIFMAKAQQAKPEDTEIWTPEPKVVTPGKTCTDAPSDAIVLFDGKNLDEWVSTKDRTQPAEWIVSNGTFSINQIKGNIQTKRLFTNFQLHIEWRVPVGILGSGQGRGNSGIFLASIGNKGNNGYELQVLDSYKNKTYVNGMAGSIYKQFIPLANPIRPPGEWQTYDVIWIAPTFNDDGTLKSAARATVLFNGVLVENNVELKGKVMYIGKPVYEKHGAVPIELQAHGDAGPSVSYCNIWVREL